MKRLNHSLLLWGLALARPTKGISRATKDSIDRFSAMPAKSASAEAK